MKCYKVVARDNGSFVLNVTKYRLFYEVGKIVKPKIGKIFVFIEEQKAIEWAKLWEGKICECECDNLQKLEKIPYIPRIPYSGIDIETQAIIEDFWERGRIIEYNTFNEVYVCDSLKVIKEV